MAQAVAAGQSSTTALKDSTETAQFQAIEGGAPAPEPQPEPEAEHPEEERMMAMVAAE